MNGRKVRGLIGDHNYHTWWLQIEGKTEINRSLDGSVDIEKIPAGLLPFSGMGLVDLLVGVMCLGSGDAEMCLLGALCIRAVGMKFARLLEDDTMCDSREGAGEAKIRSQTPGGEKCENRSSTISFPMMCFET